MRILDINPSLAGISGDMLIAALIDIVEDPKLLMNECMEIIQTINNNFQISSDRIAMDLYNGYRMNFRGTDSILSHNEITTHLTYLCNKYLRDPYMKLCLSSWELLKKAEQNVHNSSSLHLHELGTLDTVVDLFCVAFIMQKLSITKVSCHPVATGQGTVQMSHGIIPVPTPATQFILGEAKIMTVLGPIGEATTPTGAALISSIINIFPSSNQAIYDRSGYGFGTKEWSDRYNLLQVRVGYEDETRNEINVLETNLDDISGEVLGTVYNPLFNKGALDVSYYPIFTKKNRPGYTLRVICKREDTKEIGDLIMRLTGTLGIRVLSIDRHIGKRDHKKIMLNIPELGGSVSVRVKYGSRNKVEFDDILELASKNNLTPLEVQTILLKEMK